MENGYCHADRGIWAFVNQIAKEIGACFAASGGKA